MSTTADLGNICHEHSIELDLDFSDGFVVIEANDLNGYHIGRVQHHIGAGDALARALGDILYLIREWRDSADDEDEWG